MKKWIAIGVFLLFWSAEGEKISSVLYPTAKEIQEACDFGYENYSNIQIVDNIYILSGSLGTGDGVIFQTPVGGAKSTCSVDAKALRPKKYPEASFDIGMVAVFGTVNELAEAKEWAVVMVVKDSKGKELARLSTNPSSQIGSFGNWKVDCSNGCSWSGGNYYFFSLNNALFKKAVLSGGAVSVISQQNGKISTYELLPKSPDTEAAPTPIEAITQPKPVTPKQPIATKPKSPLHPNVAFISLTEFSRKMPGASFTLSEGGGSVTLDTTTLLFDTTDQTYTDVSNGGTVKPLPALPIANVNELFIPSRALEGLGCVVGFDSVTKMIAANCPHLVDAVETRVDVNLTRY